MDYPFSDPQDVYRFLEHVDERTDLFKIATLGLPWYWMAREAIFTYNARQYFKPQPPSEQEKTRRRDDFHRKVPLLNERYDYAFIIKSKTRRRDIGAAESTLFAELLEYLQAHRRSFIIFDAPIEDAAFDNKYFDSRFAAVTLPYEQLFPALGGSVQDMLLDAGRRHEADLQRIFGGAALPAEMVAPARSLLGFYQEISGLLNLAVLNQLLFSKLGIRALFGAMGTHLHAGLNNAFAVVEVEHGFFWDCNTIPVPLPPAQKYAEQTFNLQRFYKLVPSVAAGLFRGEPLCRETNRFNYGMPELRARPDVAIRAVELKRKYGALNQPVLAIATSRATDYRDLHALITALHSSFPELWIFSRPHPTADNQSAHAGFGDYVSNVRDENKYDVLMAADCLISCQSSIAVEAYAFTNNIIVYPEKSVGDDREETVKQRFPFAAAVIRLADIGRHVDQIGAFLARPSRKNPFEHPVDIAAEVERLFAGLEDQAPASAGAGITAAAPKRT